MPGNTSGWNVIFSNPQLGPTIRVVLYDLRAVITTALGDHHGEQVTSAHLTASVRAHESQVRSVLSKLVKAGLVVRPLL